MVIDTLPNAAPKQPAADPPAAAPMHPKPALKRLAVGVKDLARLLGISEGPSGAAGIKKLGRCLWPVAEVRNGLSPDAAA
jgi:hypothetical protein